MILSLCSNREVQRLKTRVIFPLVLHLTRGGQSHIHTVLTAKSGSRNFDRYFHCFTTWSHCKIALDRLTILEISQWLLNARTFVLWPNNVWEKAKGLHPLVYRVKMPGLSCEYSAYGSDHPLSDLTWVTIKLHCSNLFFLKEQILFWRHTTFHQKTKGYSGHQWRSQDLGDARA